MLEASRHSFPAIGSIALPQHAATDASSPSPTDPATVPPLGPLTHPCFYVDGRNSLSIDRGPFPTARAYFLACAERERAATRALFASGGGAAGAEYQALLADSHALVERTVALLVELVRRCEGLDGADVELARYALDLHELGPKNIIVAREDPTRIVRLLSPPDGCVGSRTLTPTIYLSACARRLAVGVRTAALALRTYAVLASAFAGRRRRRAQTEAAKRVSRSGCERRGLCACGRHRRYSPCSRRSRGVRHVPRWLSGFTDVAEHVRIYSFRSSFLIFIGDWLTETGWVIFLAVWLHFLGKRISMASANSSILRLLLVGQRVYPSSHMDPACSRWPARCQAALSATRQSPSAGIVIYTAILFPQHHAIPCPLPQLRNNCQWSAGMERP